jgi:ribosome-associated protein
MPAIPDFMILRTGESIPISALEFSTSRSGGPGGQNVNKVETRVEARFRVTETEWLSESTRQILLEKLASRIDGSGAIRVASSTERTQLGNRIAVVRRMEQLLNRALTPEKKRIPTRATRAAKERRLEVKKKLSEKKNSRQWRP